MQSAALCSPQTTESAGAARGSSFYTAMRIMPARQREAMYAVYAFCRAVDDIADCNDSPAERLEALKQWRQNIALLYTGNPPSQLRELANAVEYFDLPQDNFLAVIDGMEMDVHGPIQAPSFATLYLYCDRVACAVGRLCVRIMGVEDPAGTDLAHHLGLALQLTNILRDLDEDAAMDRFYLPAELLAKAGIERSTPIQMLSSPAIQQVCMAIADEALSYFQTADEIMNRCERKHVRTARVMSQAYCSLYEALVKRGFVTPRRPVRLNKARLVFILTRNLLF